MAESPDTAAEVFGPDRADYVRHVLGTARATLARGRANDEKFRERPAEPLGGVVPEWRSRGRRAPLGPRDRQQPTPTPTPVPAPQPEVLTWQQERTAVFEAICALRHLCETLAEQLAEVRHKQTREFGMLGAWRALSEWSDEERARIEQESLQQQREKEEPLDLPPLHSLRQ